MKLDARGKACPIPVIMAKKELDNGEKNLEILVDGKVQIDNLDRLAKSYGRTIETSPCEDKFLVKFSEGDGTVPDHASSYDTGSFGVFFNKASVGSGNAELGLNLAKMAIFTLSEGENIPSYIFFMNDGVKLTTGIEPQIIENLKTLIDKGTTVLVCGTCLNFFGVKNDCKVGTISNMYDILSAMEQVSKVITL